MTKDQIKKVILEAVGNPSVGAVAGAADAQAEALFKALNPEVKTKKVEKEIRIEESEETR